MTILDWALHLGALVLAGYAGWSVLADPHVQKKSRGTPGGKGGPAGRRALGCGFGLVALGVWSFSFSNLLGSWTDGVRVAGGSVLLLAAIGGLLRGRIVRAVAAVVVGALIAGPVLPRAWSLLSPSDSQAVLRELEAELSTLETRIADLDRLQRELTADADQLQARVRGGDHADYDALAADTEARGALRELADVERMRARTGDQANRARAALEANRDLLRRMTRHIQAEEALGREATRAELEDLAREFQRPEAAAPGEQTLDDVVEDQKLRELFERVR